MSDGERSDKRTIRILLQESALEVGDGVAIEVRLLESISEL